MQNFKALKLEILSIQFSYTYVIHLANLISFLSEKWKSPVKDLQKPTKLSQELKSKLNLKPIAKINDTLMHCQEAPTTWL